MLYFRYPPSRYVAVIMITVGIAMATIASAHQLVSDGFAVIVKLMDCVVTRATGKRRGNWLRPTTSN